MEKTANGSCWECRRRRLVCDRTLPGCQKCVTRSLACPGYAAKPLRWLQPQQVRSKVRRKGNFSGSALQSIPLSLPDKEVVVFEAVEYYNARICPDLVADGITGSASPFFMPPANTRFTPRACIESVICTALCHRILQLTDGQTASEKAILSTKLQKHRGEAIRQLTALLANSEEQTSDATLASVLTLLLAEIQQTFSPDWQRHSEGATAIIAMRGGLGELVFSRPWLRDLLRYYVIVEVIGTTTSPTISLPTALRQLDMINLLPILYGNGLSSCFPCSPELFVAVIRINHLRAQFHSASQSDATDRHAAAMDILGAIRAFVPDAWALRLYPSVNINSAPLQPQLSGSTPVRRPLMGWLQGWLAMGRIYQCAVAMYCISALLSDTKGDAMSGVRKSCQAMLVQQLRSLHDCENTQLRKLVIWPLVIAGIGIRTEDEDTQEFILKELAWISKEVGIAAPLLAREFLRKVWLSPVEDRKWDGLFDRPYLFAV